MRQLLGAMIRLFSTGKYAAPLFLLDMALLFALEFFLPLWLIRRKYQKTGRVKRLAILPCFLLGYLFQTFADIFFFLDHPFSNIGNWACILLPFFAFAYAPKFCGCPNKKESEKSE